MSRGTIGPGVFVPIVGPSGAGKDSLMAYARRHLAGCREVHFARRVVTRRSDPSSEAHDTLDEETFARAEAAGAFALSWRSHGLSYGIPIAVDETVRAGGVVVANLSRASVGDAATRYARVAPVLVTVSAETLAERLAARGRETADDIAARIARNADHAGLAARCRVIDNSGSLNEAGEQLVRLLRAAMDRDAASAH